jgi:hypothetical protein
MCITQVFKVENRWDNNHKNISWAVCNALINVDKGVDMIVIQYDYEDGDDDDDEIGEMIYIWTKIHGRKDFGRWNYHDYASQTLCYEIYLSLKKLSPFNIE